MENMETSVIIDNDDGQERRHFANIVINNENEVTMWQYGIAEDSSSTNMENQESVVSTTSVRIDKDDVRASRHYVNKVFKDGKEVKMWQCGLCGKEFKFQYTLVRHIPTHTDVRNYQCNMCPKAFRQLSTLAQHKVTHLNRRPFVCEYCGKSFNRSSTLISHRKIHYDIKSHICTYCGKGFHQKGNLRNHMFTHTNERPYKCEYCLKGFNQKSNLVCHKLSTHLKKVFHCVICGLKFTREASYNEHMSGIHNTPVLSGNRSTIDDGTNNIVMRVPVAYQNVSNNNEGECSGPSGSSSSSALVINAPTFEHKIQIPVIKPILKSNDSNAMVDSVCGRKFPILDIGTGIKNKTAIVYTKTHPKVGSMKPRLHVPSHENSNLDESHLLHAKCLECSSRTVPPLTLDGCHVVSMDTPASNSQQPSVAAAPSDSSALPGTPSVSSSYPYTFTSQVGSHNKCGPRMLSVKGPRVEKPRANTGLYDVPVYLKSDHFYDAETESHFLSEFIEEVTEGLDSRKFAESVAPSPTTTVFGSKPSISTSEQPAGVEMTDLESTLFDSSDATKEKLELDMDLFFLNEDFSPELDNGNLFHSS